MTGNIGVSGAPIRKRTGLIQWSALRPAVRVMIGTALIVIAAVAPLSMNGYWRYLAALIVAYAVANIGFQVVVGWSGQLAMAHAAFLGLGAYATTILSKKIEKVSGYTNAGAEIRKQIWSGRVPYLLALFTVGLVGCNCRTCHSLTDCKPAGEVFLRS